MSRIDELEVMPPADYLTTYGIEVRMTPIYSSPGFIAGVRLTIPSLPIESPLFDLVEGPWTVHAEAFKAGVAGAESWIGVLDPTRRN